MWKEKMKILIVEDEPAIMRLIKCAIGEMEDGFEVAFTAYNGKEALKILRRKKVHIVITDIMMPVMTGLELIETSRKEKLDTNFLLLTGYEKFEYARQAIELGVANYLLKPIQVEKLQDALRELRDKLEVKSREHRMHLVQRMYMEKGLGINEEEFQSFFLISAFFGGFGSSYSYVELHHGMEIIQEIDFRFLLQLEEKYGVEIYQVKGMHQNEYIFGIISGAAQFHRVGNLQKDVLKELQKSGVQVTLCSTEYITQISMIKESIKDLYFTISTKLEFGESKILKNTLKEKNHIIQSSVFVREVMKDIFKASGKKAEIEEVVKNLSAYWGKEQATQLVVATDLKYLFENLEKNESASLQSTDVNELICISNSYEELEENLVEEIYKITIPEWKEKMGRSRNGQLAREVGIYLEQNFTSQINYKLFHEMFGYHERYVAQIFKEELGMSPGKFVLEKRIELAKKLLKEGGEIKLREVAEIVGYSDSLYFSRVFQANVGMSPSAFTKDCREKKKQL